MPTPSTTTITSLPIPTSAAAADILLFHGAGVVAMRKCLFAYLPLVALLHIIGCGSVVVPASSCYALDNSSRLVDFTDRVGRSFEYNGKDADLVVRFCKDIESRSQEGYVNFGHYSPYDHFVAGSGPVHFHQGFYNGDLARCEQSYDKMGRTAQVNILCGNCLQEVCKGDFGCVCGVTYDATMCRAFIELAVPCKKDGPRVFKGFTVGFHPRSWEVVYNGLTQQGFEKAHQEFSFGTEQNNVFLYITAISSLSDLVGKPSFKVSPDKGLDVKLSDSRVNGNSPSTLSPTILAVNWRCERARDSPYEVAISIPVKGYDPPEFTLTKFCEYSQPKQGDSLRGWSAFGVVSCILLVLSTLFCCGGFIYRVNIEQQHGVDALPGITTLSACLEALSGPRSYRQPEDIYGNSSNQAVCEGTSISTNGYQRTRERTYGSI